MKYIAKNRVVSMRYSMRNDAGEILENTFQGSSVNYLHGGATVHPVLQAQLDGMKAGDTKTVYLDAATAASVSAFVFDVIIDDVRLATQEEVLLGNPVQLPAGACAPDCGCYVIPRKKQ